MNVLMLMLGCLNENGEKIELPVDDAGVKYDWDFGGGLTVVFPSHWEGGFFQPMTEEQYGEIVKVNGEYKWGWGSEFIVFYNGITEKCDTQGDWKWGDGEFYVDYWEDQSGDGGGCDGFYEP